MNHPYIDTAAVAFTCLVPFLAWFCATAGANEISQYFERKRQQRADEFAKAQVILGRFQQIRDQRRGIPKQRTEGDAS